MNPTKKVYPWKIKDEASKVIDSILNYSETVDYRMHGQVCRITVADLTISDNIRPQYHKDFAKDHLWQVQVLGIEDRQFLVLQSKLVPLDEVVIVDGHNKTQL